MRITRLLPLISVVMLLSLLLGAVPVSAGPAAAFQTPIITMGLSQEPPGLGYGLESAYVASIVKMALGSEPDLTRQNDLTDWYPYLAAEVPLLENGGAFYAGEGADQRLTVVFNMRNDVSWTDGTPVTAGDVAFTFQLVMNPDYPIPDRSGLVVYNNWEATEDYQVTVSFLSENEARDAAANGRGMLPAKDFSDFAAQEGPVVTPGYFKGYSAFPRHLLQPIIDQVGVLGLAKHEIQRRPVGVGPFKLREWVEGQHIIADAVPGYFLGSPRTGSLVFKFIPDTNTLLAQLATGELDAATSDALSVFNAPDLDELERQRRIRAFYVPSTTWEHIDLNMDSAHLSDLRVRKALIHSINRNIIVDRVLFSKTQVIHSWLPAWGWAYNRSIPQYEHNPARARELLREAGYTAGSDGIMAHPQKGKLSVLYQTTAGNAMRLAVTQIIQAQAREVGIDLRLDYISPPAAFFAGGANPGPLKRRTYEMGEYAFLTSDDPEGAKGLYHSNSIPAAGNGFVGDNNPGIRNPRLDELLHLSDTSLDQAQRTIWLSEAQVIWANELPVIPLFSRPNASAVKRTFQNWRPAPTPAAAETWNAHDWYLAD